MNTCKTCGMHSKTVCMRDNNLNFADGCKDWMPGTNNGFWKCSRCNWTNSNSHKECNGCGHVEQGIKTISDRYEELINAVARIFPGETRHETALRYIQEREQTAVVIEAFAKQPIGKI